MTVRIGSVPVRTGQRVGRFHVWARMFDGFRVCWYRVDMVGAGWYVYRVDMYGGQIGDGEYVDSNPAGWGRGEWLGMVHLLR